MKRAARRVAALAFPLVLSVAGLGWAQRFDVGRGLTVVTGGATGLSPTEGIDRFHQRESDVPLPEGRLRIAWRKGIGGALDRAPLVGRGGDVILLTTRGDLVTLRADGTERARLSLGAPAAAAPVLLSDGSFAVLLTNGEASAMSPDGQLRYRTSLGAARLEPGRAAALATLDGGVVFPRGRELSWLDGAGVLRARVTLPDPVAGALLDGDGAIVASTTAGALYTWVPGAEPRRLAQLSASAEQNVLWAPRWGIVATTGGRELTRIGADGGPELLRVEGGGSSLAGAPALGRERLFVLEVGIASALVELAPDGGEVGRRGLGGPGFAMADGGAAPVHADIVLDREGRVAFALPDGSVGVVTPGGIELAPEPPCARLGGLPSRPSVTIVGLAPAAPGAFYVACDSGILVRIEGTP